MSNAYDVNTNTNIRKGAAASNIVEAALTGAANKLEVKELDWNHLGLNRDIHGDEVQRLAAQILADNNFDAATYGSIGSNEESQRATSKLLDAVAADGQTGATAKVMEIVNITKDFSRTSLNNKPQNFLMRLVGMGRNKIADVRQKYETVDGRLTNILDDINEFTNEMMHNSETARELSDINIRELHSTALKIAAGRIALNTMISQMHAVDGDGKSFGYTLQQSQQL
ncbi:MAG: toxic anion resistance protein, partial [Acinetobacter sp.]